MSLRALETEILQEARKVVGKQSLRMKDIIEWRTSELGKHDGETLYYLPSIGVWVLVLNSSLPKRIRKVTP